MSNNFLQNPKMQFMTAFGVSAALIAISSIIGSADKPNYAVNLNLAHTRSTGSFADLAANKFKEILEQNSNNTVGLTVYPNSGIAGGDVVRSIEMLNDGSLDIQICSAAQLSTIDPRFEAFWLPFLFENEEQFEYFINDKEVQSTLSKWLDEKGLVLLGISNSGARQFSNDSHEITKPDDFKDLKISVSPYEIISDTYKALGAQVEAKSLASVPRALRAGEVDGQANTVTNFLSNKLYESQKFITLWDGIWDANIWTISKKQFEKLSDQQKDILVKSAQEAMAWRNDLYNKFKPLMTKTLTDKGVKVTELTAEQKEAFRNAVIPVYEKYVDRIGLDNIMFFLNHRGVEAIEPVVDINPLSVAQAAADLINQAVNQPTEPAQEQAPATEPAQEQAPAEQNIEAVEPTPEAVEQAPTEELPVIEDDSANAVEVEITPVEQAPVEQTTEQAQVEAEVVTAPTAEAQVEAEAETEAAPVEQTTQAVEQAPVEQEQVEAAQAQAPAEVTPAEQANEAVEQAPVEQEQVEAEVVTAPQAEAQAPAEVTPAEQANEAVEQAPVEQEQVESEVVIAPQAEAQAPAEVTPAEQANEAVEQAPVEQEQVEAEVVIAPQAEAQAPAEVTPAEQAPEQAPVEQEQVEAEVVIAPAAQAQTQAPVEAAPAEQTAQASEQAPADAQGSVAANITSDQANVPGFDPIVPSNPGVAGFEPVVTDVPAVNGFAPVVDSYPRHVTQPLAPYAVRPAPAQNYYTPGQPRGFENTAGKIQCAPGQVPVSQLPPAQYIQQITYQLVEVAPNQFQMVPVIQYVPAALAEHFTNKAQKPAVRAMPLKPAKPVAPHEAHKPAKPAAPHAAPVAPAAPDATAVEPQQTVPAPQVVPAPVEQVEAAPAAVQAAPAVQAPAPQESAERPVVIIEAEPLDAPKATEESQPQVVQFSAVKEA